MAGWTEFAEIVVKGAEEICEVREKGVENPWMVGKEEEVERMRREISLAQESRNAEVEKQRRGEDDHPDDAQGMI